MICVIWLFDCFQYWARTGLSNINWNDAGPSDDNVWKYLSRRSRGSNLITFLLFGGEQQGSGENLNSNGIRPNDQTNIIIRSLTAVVHYETAEIFIGEQCGNKRELSRLNWLNFFLAACLILPSDSESSVKSRHCNQLEWRVTIKAEFHKSRDGASDGAQICSQ